MSQKLFMLALEDEVVVTPNSLDESIGVQYSIDNELDPFKPISDELDSQIHNLEFGVENLTTLESIINAVSLESISNPSTAQAVNISIEALCSKLGLEASDMTYHSLESSSDDVKTQTEHSQGKLKNAWDKVIEFIKNIWKKLQEFFHRYTSIIAANLVTWTSNMTKRIEKLPDSGKGYDATVEIDNLTLARAFNLTSPSSVLTIEKADHFVKQLTYIGNSLNFCFKKISTQDLTFMSDEGNVMASMIAPIRNEVLVGGLGIVGAAGGGTFEVIYEKPPTSGKIKLHTPSKKSDLSNLNKDTRSHIGVINSLFIGMSVDTRVQTKIIHGLEKIDAKGEGIKEANMSADAVKDLKLVYIEVLEFLKLMQVVTTDTYRALIKYISVTCNEIEKLS